ncbi:MAG: hypothetical protein GSR85_09410 [Desulfurococcales archaeon]|nr:hypothetical protein [Desulfurococcales archaeon]
MSKRVVVTYKGSRIYAEEADGLFKCPICRTAIFYTEKDLIAHIIGHALGNIDKTKSISRT